jgi:CRISPR type I-E-associated protein CasB/Cse2
MNGSQFFVDALEHLNPTSLSLLRRSTGQSLAESVPAFDLFTAIFWPLRERYRGLSRQACWRVATLYSWHPQPFGTDDLGLGLGRLVPFGYRDVDVRERKRQRRWFEALLTSDGAGLDAVLKHAVGRLARHRIPIDWRQLLEDLTVWRSSRHVTQIKWATSYYLVTNQGGIHAR